MTLKKAIESGKPFKRPNGEFWIVVFMGWFFTHSKSSMTTLGVDRFLYTLSFSVAMGKPGVWHKIVPKGFMPTLVSLSVESVLAKDWELLEGKP